MLNSCKTQEQKKHFEHFDVEHHVLERKNMFQININIPHIDLKQETVLEKDNIYWSTNIGHIITQSMSE